MPEARKYIPFILVFVLIITGFAAYFLLRSSKKPTLTESQNQNTNIDEQIPVEVENLGNIDPESLTATTKENLATARDKATVWHKDVVLSAASIKLNSLAVNEGTETYVFDSPAEPTNHFVVSISQKSKRYIRAIIPADDYLGMGLLPIDFQYWKLNYAHALQIAEKEGGAEFRDQNLNWYIELTLRRTEPKNWLYWICEYKQEQGNSLTVKINALNGEVVKESE